MSRSTRSTSKWLPVLALAGLTGLGACIGAVSSPPGDDDRRPDAGRDPDPDPEIDASVDPDPDPEIDASTPDPEPTPDAAPDPGCGEWQVGTLTGYNNSDLGDDPNAGSVVEFTGLDDEFYDNVNMAAVDYSDFHGDKYRWIDVRFGGRIGRVGVWDACRNEDCPDGTDCCTDNKQLYAFPGYLVDVETRTARRLFGIDNAENTLRHEIDFRICGGFDPDAIASRYGAYRW